MGFLKKYQPIWSSAVVWQVIAYIYANIYEQRDFYVEFVKVILNQKCNFKNWTEFVQGSLSFLPSSPSRLGNTTPPSTS